METCEVAGKWQGKGRLGRFIIGMHMALDIGRRVMGISPDDMLAPDMLAERRGAIFVGFPSMGLCVPTLRRLPQEAIKLNSEVTLLRWVDGRITANLVKGKMLTNLHVDSLSEISELVRDDIWHQTEAIYLEKEGNRHRYLKELSGAPPPLPNEDNDVRLIPLQQPGLLFGGPPARLNIDGKRSIFLVGPSGCGKTTSVQVAAKGKRLLKVHASFISRYSIGQLMMLLAIMAPDVLLLEDMQGMLESKDAYEELLFFIESLHGKLMLVGTIMDERAEFNAGDLYFEGMRGGRFDQLVFVGLPDEGRRQRLLAYHLRKEPPPWLVVETNGLSYANIQALAETIRTLPQDAWREEVRCMQIMSPDRKKARQEPLNGHALLALKCGDAQESKTCVVFNT